MLPGNGIESSAASQAENSNGTGTAVTPVVTKSSQRLWWAALMFILLLGGILRFTGYNFQLPFRYIDGLDETALFMDSNIIRGADHRPMMNPGYSPGIFFIDGSAQIIGERISGRSALDESSLAVSLVRFWAASVGILTALLIALLTRQMAGNGTALLAAGAWLALPGPNYQTVREQPMAWVVLFSTLARGRHAIPMPALICKIIVSIDAG